MNELTSDINTIVILSENIIPEYIADSWLDKRFKFINRQTNRSVEKYIIIELVKRIKSENININNVLRMIDDRIKFLILDQTNYRGNARIGISKLREVKQDTFSIQLIDRMIREIYNIENLLFMKTILCGNRSIDEVKYDEISSSTQSLLRDLEFLKQLVIELDANDERILALHDRIETLLYKNKDYYPYNSFNYNYKSKIDDNKLMNFDDVTINDIFKIFISFETIVETGYDSIIEYLLSELMIMKKNIESKKIESKIVKEDYNISFEEIEYDNMVRKFESMTLDDITTDDEIDVIKIAEYYQLATEIAKYEILSEESSTKIITRGTEKATRAIGNISSKSHGMASEKSKVGAIKRGARIVDDRASDAVNRKIDSIINLGQDAKREKIITGKNTFKLSKALKSAIALLTGGGIAAGAGKAVGAKVAGKLAAKGAVGKVAAVGAKVALGPLVGATIAIIGALAIRALHKNTETRERKRIMLELETELKIVKEKVEDAKAENDKEAKYRLMRTQAALEKEITRIKHNLRYY